MTVDSAYGEVQRLTRKRARNFAYGIMVLPREKRRAIAAMACRFARGSTMIPYAKFFASRRVMRPTSAYASCALIARARARPRARGARATGAGGR